MKHLRAQRASASEGLQQAAACLAARGQARLEAAVQSPEMWRCRGFFRVCVCVACGLLFWFFDCFHPQAVLELGATAWETFASLKTQHLVQSSKRLTTRRRIEGAFLQAFKTQGTRWLRSQQPPARCSRPKVQTSFRTSSCKRARLTMVQHLQPCDSGTQARVI